MSIRTTRFPSFSVSRQLFPDGSSLSTLSNMASKPDRYLAGAFQINQPFEAPLVEATENYPPVGILETERSSLVFTRA